MKILLLCNKSPWPALEGGPIAMNAMVTGLIAAGHQVKVLAINSNKYNISPGSIPGHYRRETGIELIYIDLSVKPLPAFLNLFTGKSYHVERFISDEFANKLSSLLKNEEFDIIQFETLFTTPYLSLIRRLSGARLVLRAHNIEHLIWKRVAAGCKNPLKKLYLTHLARTLRKYELDILRKVDGVAAITEKDADFFRNASPSTPVVAIPFGVTVTGTEEKSDDSLPDDNPTLFHLGSMNWIPNLEGIDWFIGNVWPKLNRKYPWLRFHLAGREMPARLSNADIPGIVIDGEIPDASSYMLQHSVMIVPLFSGSGIRIKIIEGMMTGKAIITTGIGAEGIRCTDGEDILIANDAAGFEAAVEKCIASPQLVKSLGANAKNLVIREHDNAILMQKTSDFYSCLRQ